MSNLLKSLVFFTFKNIYLKRGKMVYLSLCVSIHPHWFNHHMLAIAGSESGKSQNRDFICIPSQELKYSSHYLLLPRLCIIRKLELGVRGGILLQVLQDGMLTPHIVSELLSQMPTLATQSLAYSGCLCSRLSLCSKE